MKISKRALSSATLLGAVVLIEGWSHGRPAWIDSAWQRSVVRPVVPQDRRDFLLDSTAESAAATIAVALAAAVGTDCVCLLCVWVGSRGAAYSRC